MLWIFFGYVEQEWLDGDRDGLSSIYLPNAVEIHIKCLHDQFRNCGLQKFSSALQVGVVVLGFFAGIAVEGSQPAVSSTIGVQHQDCGPSTMQAHGLANLFQDELAITFMIGRPQAFCSSGNPDG